jgi:hypothetical protein
MEKKITKATFKSFIKKNIDGLYINVKSKFDGMTDMCEAQNGGFVKATADNRDYCLENTLGIEGLWLVGSGHRGDRFRPYSEGAWTGIEYSNCCGRGIIAVRNRAA